MSDKDQRYEFKDFFRFTKDGRMKSGTVVYSFTFAALYLVVYGAVYYFMIDVLAPLSNHVGMFLSDVISAVVPALIGALICFVPQKIISNKKPAFLGYVWILVFAVVFLIAMVILLKDDKDALRIFLRLFAVMVPAPILIGGGLAFYQWKKSEKIEKTPEDYD